MAKLKSNLGMMLALLCIPLAPVTSNPVRLPEDKFTPTGHGDFEISAMVDKRATGSISQTGIAYLSHIGAHGEEHHNWFTKAGSGVFPTSHPEHTGTRSHKSHKTERNHHTSQPTLHSLPHRVLVPSVEQRAEASGESHRSHSFKSTRPHSAHSTHPSHTRHSTHSEHSAHPTQSLRDHRKSIHTFDPVTLQNATTMTHPSTTYCLTTLYLPHSPEFAPGTKTVWTSTATLYPLWDCHGCPSLTVVDPWTIGQPTSHYRHTKTSSSVISVVSPVCKPSRTSTGVMTAA